MRMKPIFLFMAVAAILFAVIGFVYTRNQQYTIVQMTPVPSLPSAAPTMQSPTISNLPTVNPSNALQSYCTTQNLQASLALSPGAGNVYGTLTLKNISQNTCIVQGNAAITAEYNHQAVKNISVSYEGTPATTDFVLAPHQILYSQIHYPNGPQCQSGIQTAQVTFTYQISSGNTVSFANEAGSTQQAVTNCKALSETTDIQIWNVATQPITPQ